MFLIDSHCHLDFDAFANDLNDVVTRANDQSVDAFILPAVSAEHWQRLFDVSSSITNSYVALGLHPYFIEQHKTSDLILLQQFLSTKDSVAVGECGLDTFCPEIEKQQHFFMAQIELANQFNKPLIVQCFKKVKPQKGGVIHAFSGSLQDANKYIQLGFKLGAGGVITYERASKTRQVFSQIGLEHIVLETDSPDMPLAGKQGLRNEPQNIIEVAQVLAELQQTSITEVAHQTSLNCQSLFGLKF